MTTTIMTNLNCNAGRRSFLAGTGLSLGSAALATLLSNTGGAATSGIAPGSEPRWRGVVQPLHHAARVKRVIHLCMAGGPSHLETLDFKPKLAELHGQAMPDSFTKGQQIAQLQARQLNCLGPQLTFRKCGQSGQEISNALPHLQGIADQICIVRSLHTEQINHDPAHTFMNTGSGIPGRPSMGSWILYGLGSDTEELPGYVVLVSAGGGQGQPIASRQWHSGFLPSRFQGVQFQAAGDPVLYVGNPAGISTGAQRGFLDSLQELNRIGNQRLQDRELETRVSQYEMAFRMQTSTPELMDISQEPDHILTMYGLERLKGTRGGDGSFASNCLLARRMAERGVRFIQLYHRGWDHHGGVKAGVEYTGGLVDQGAAALVTDLQQRGLLEDTLVIWGGEFGRTPMGQGDGRDHHIKGFSMWLAGGGIRAGKTYGATDELGYAAVENPVHVHDLHATMLHLLGIDHQRLTFPFQGRDYRLTDVHGHVVSNILG
ncbi:MAG: DUF1501 domain-containing protein [Planctomycetota bacterium]|nr:DUF1501 domain-containing protein [Planctomycetota bacterium]